MFFTTYISSITFPIMLYKSLYNIKQKIDLAIYI